MVVPESGQKPTYRVYSNVHQWRNIHDYPTR